MQKSLLIQVYEHTLILGDYEIHALDDKIVSMLPVLTSVYYYQPAIFHFGFKPQLLALIFDSFSLENIYHGVHYQDILCHVQGVPQSLHQNLPVAVIKYFLFIYLTDKQINFKNIV